MYCAIAPPAIVVVVLSPRRRSRRDLDTQPLSPAARSSFLTASRYARGDRGAAEPVLVGRPRRQDAARADRAVFAVAAPQLGRVAADESGVAARHVAEVAAAVRPDLERRGRAGEAGEALVEAIVEREELRTPVSVEVARDRLGAAIAPPVCVGDIHSS